MNEQFSDQSNNQEGQARQILGRELVAAMYTKSRTVWALEARLKAVSDPCSDRYIETMQQLRTARQELEALQALGGQIALENTQEYQSNKYDVSRISSTNQILDDIDNYVNGGGKPFTNNRMQEVRQRSNNYLVYRFFVDVLSATNSDLDRVHANAKGLLLKTHNAIARSFREGRVPQKIKLEDFDGVLNFIKNPPHIKIGKSDEILDLVKSGIDNISTNTDFEYIE